MTMRDKGYHDERSAVVSSPRPTPYQQEILELASIGLSYDEIAARLSVSSRTIRFQLEKIFRLLGVIFVFFRSPRVVHADAQNLSRIQDRLEQPDLAQLEIHLAARCQLL